MQNISVVVQYFYMYMRSGIDVNLLSEACLPAITQPRWLSTANQEKWRCNLCYQEKKQRRQALTDCVHVCTYN